MTQDKHISFETDARLLVYLLFNECYVLLKVDVLLFESCIHLCVFKVNLPDPVTCDCIHAHYLVIRCILISVGPLLGTS